MSGQDGKHAGRRVVVVGGGHNGLVAAGLLARRGREVVLVERRGVLGGLAAAEDLGTGAAAHYRVPGVLPDTCGLRPEVVAALDLTRVGLTTTDATATVLAAEPGGPGLLISADAAATSAELAPRSAADAEAWTAWRAQIDRFAPAIMRLFDAPALDPAAGGWSGLRELAGTGLALRRLGRRDLTELLRIGPMCVGDWLGEWFETPLLKGALAAPATLGTWLGPWSAGTSALLLRQLCTAGPEVQGGPAAVIDALVAAAREAGVETRVNAEATAIEVEDERVTAVRLADGERLACDVVVTGCDPRRALLGLVGRRALPSRTARRVGVFRCRGTTALVRLGLDGPLEFAGREGERLPRALAVGDLDDLERAFDGVKYGRGPASPALDVWVPSVTDPSLAPEGCDVVSLLVSSVPHDLKGGWSDVSRKSLRDVAVRALERVAPGVSARIAVEDVLAPPDIAERYGVTGGQIHHGEPALDQLLHMRPAPECSRSATPIAGLFLGSSGSHPGGGLTGVPGLLAARAVLDS